MSKKSNRIFKPKPCFFHVEKIKYIDYKDVELVSKYINNHGKILSSKITGNCAKHQRLISNVIKRARIMALIPFISERIRK
ncbi:30S ribosomal protein S18 [[Mycoplasma] mobile]|uniref:30S ribosomal protein S18 n=1 Tax=[Mycoplasma] mobile TaxID=2118 RepID=UPI00059B77EE